MEINPFTSNHAVRQYFPENDGAWGKITNAIVLYHMPPYVKVINHVNEL